MTTLQVKPGFRCSCHHPGRRCNYQCPAVAVLVRDSDHRPTCAHCKHHNPADSAGFGFPPQAIEEAAA